MASFAIAGFLFLIVACGVGFGVASADSADDLARAGSFGFDEATHAATRASASGPAASADAGQLEAVSEQQVLTVASTRDISAGLAMLDEREAAERARIEADNKAVFGRVEAMKAKQGVAPSAPAGAAPEPGTSEYGLPAVDWSCGRDAFLAEWAGRIDAYLGGSELAGYGDVFAEAAWENGVDPRWSPAVSNTESSKGVKCFRSHNAWGWGEDDWPDWETAITEHVAGLGRVYGYSITPSAAQVYCPPNHANWYADTLGQMALI